MKRSTKCGLTVARCDFYVWDAGGSDSYVYTENWEFARELRKEFSKCGTYHRTSSPCAWQFRVPKRLIGILNRRLKKLQDAKGANLQESMSEET